MYMHLLAIIKKNSLYALCTPKSQNYFQSKQIILKHDAHNFHTTLHIVFIKTILGEKYCMIRKRVKYDFSPYKITNFQV